MVTEGGLLSLRKEVSMKDTWERHYFLATCSKHGTATVSACQTTLKRCARCQWEARPGIHDGKFEFKEITKEEYRFLEDAHWFELFGTHRYPEP